MVAYSVLTRRRSASRQRAEVVVGEVTVVVESREPVDPGDRSVVLPGGEPCEQFVGGDARLEHEWRRTGLGELLRSGRHRRRLRRASPRRGRPSSDRRRSAGSARSPGGVSAPGSAAGARRRHRDRRPRWSAAPGVALRVAVVPSVAVDGALVVAAGGGVVPVRSRTQVATWRRVGKSRSWRLSSRSSW